MSRGLNDTEKAAYEAWVEGGLISPVFLDGIRTKNPGAWDKYLDIVNVVMRYHRG
jgi:hypothetical protein